MKRPFTVIALFVLSLINGLLAAYKSLAFAGVLPLRLFGGKFIFFVENLSWIAVLFTAMIAFAWFVSAWLVWKMRRESWNTLITISGLYLLAIVIILLGQTSWQELILPILSNILVIVLCSLPSTRKALIPPSWGDQH